MSLFVVLAVIGSTAVNAYSNGPPLDACTEMFPVGHKVDAQTSNSTVTIKVKNSEQKETTSYTANETLTITVSTSNTSDTSVYFEGLFVQARKTNCSDTTPQGTFSVASDSSYLKTLDCNSLNKSAVSQKNATHQTSQTFTWTAPSTTVGHIYFQATVVKSKEVFWTGVRSDFIRDSSDSTNPSYCSVRNKLDTGRASAVTWTPLLVLLACCTAYLF